MRRTALVVLLLLAAAMIGPTRSGLAQTSQPAVAQPSVRADFNQDGFADLAAGAPSEAVGTAELAGAVSVLYGSAGGLTATGARLVTEAGDIRRPTTGSVRPRPRGTSTRTGSPISQWAPRSRGSVAGSTAARSASCTAQPAG